MITPFRTTSSLPGTLKNLFYPPEQGEYTYFARAKQSPFVGGSAVVKAAWAADASMLSYARYGAVPPWTDVQRAQGQLLEAKAVFATILTIGPDPQQLERSRDASRICFRVPRVRDSRISWNGA